MYNFILYIVIVYAEDFTFKYDNEKWFYINTFFKTFIDQKFIKKLCFIVQQILYNFLIYLIY